MTKKIHRSILKSPTKQQLMKDVEALQSGKSPQIESVKQRIKFMIKSVSLESDAEDLLKI